MAVTSCPRLCASCATRCPIIPLPNNAIFMSFVLLPPSSWRRWNSPVFVKSENQEIEHSESWFAGSFEPARMKARRGKSIVELHASGWNLASLHDLHKIGSRSREHPDPGRFLLFLHDLFLLVLLLAKPSTARRPPYAKGLIAEGRFSHQPAFSKLRSWLTKSCTSLAYNSGSSQAIK